MATINPPPQTQLASSSKLDLFQVIHKNLWLSKHNSRDEDFSNHWRTWFTPSKVNRFAQARYLRSFRSGDLNRLSAGLDDQKDWFETIDILLDLLNFFPKSEVDQLIESQIGAPPSVKVARECYNGHDLSLVNFALRVQHFSPERPTVFCEIGAGYGGLGYKLKKIFPEATIILLDLPEACALQTYYLSEAMPTAKILTYLELVEIQRFGSAIDSTLRSYDFAVLPAFVASVLPNNFVDVFINTRSMMEMNIRTIQSYFDFIHRSLRIDGILYNVNRYRKDTVGVPIRLKEYPYDERWAILHSAPSFRQPELHELVTKRMPIKNDGFKISINQISDGNRHVKRTIRRQSKPGIFAKEAWRVFIPSSLHVWIRRAFFALGRRYGWPNS